MQVHSREVYPSPFLWGVTCNEPFFVRCMRCGGRSPKKMCNTTQMRKELGFKWVDSTVTGGAWLCCHCNTNMDPTRQLGHPPLQFALGMVANMTPQLNT